MKALSRLAVALLFGWLLLWIVVYRSSILDDSLIHLRYAAFLRQVHFITFDGVQRTFGTSSLMFVGLLAALRGLTVSPLMPRAVSTVAHLVLFAVMAIAYLRAVAGATSRRVQVLALTALFLLVPLSAIRWLDDGMETSLVMCLVGLTAWWVHRLSLRESVSSAAWGGTLVLGCGLVLLRNELAVVDVLGVVVLTLSAANRVGSRLRTLTARSGLLVGGLLTAVCIRLIMGSYLPDTALAKSHGFHHFGPTIGAAEQVMAGSLIFGVGSMVLWLVSSAMLLRQRETRVWPTLAANALFPIVLLGAAVRGQEIQGARYLVWTFFFSIVWNLLELWRIDTSFRPEAVAAGARLWTPSRDASVLTWLLLVLLLAVPLDTRLMRRILGLRGETTRMFMSADLAAALRGHSGVAYDIGYIAYFSEGALCDMSGLVNGPVAAKLTMQQRAARCAAERPDFAYLNRDQDHPLSTYVDLKNWVVCGQYDLPNIRTTDRHYLLVAPERAAQVCAANRFTPAPSPYR